ncbi:uncharacterized protein [Ptychodera flava]|uniref:uncharacterized protein n=1 Tax=Ptychodera flava TaxID=63121 RepID=UPI00396A278F
MKCAQLTAVCLVVAMVINSSQTMDLKLQDAEANSFLRSRFKRWILPGDCEDIDEFVPPPSTPAPTVEVPGPCTNVTDVIPNTPIIDCVLLNIDLCTNTRDILIRVTDKLVDVIIRLAAALQYLSRFLAYSLSFVEYCSCAILNCAIVNILKYLLWDLCLGPTLDLFLVFYK